MGGGGSSRNFPGSILCGVAGFFPLTAVTDPKFMLFKHVLCFARIMSTLCPNSCRQTARIGGGAAAPPAPPSRTPMPPTSAPTKYHSLRVFHQVQQWQGYTLPAEDWGWWLSKARYKPVSSDFGPATQSLLDIVRCTYKTGCGPLRCGCRRQGMPCSSACSGCRRICQNMSNNDVDDNEDGDSDM